MEAPLILPDIVHLDDVTILDLRVDATGHHNLVFVDGTGCAFHDVEKHRGNKLPFLCYYVVSHTNFGDFSGLVVEATHEIDEPFIISNSLFFDELDLKLVRALRFLQENLVIIIIEIEP